MSPRGAPGRGDTRAGAGRSATVLDTLPHLQRSVWTDTRTITEDVHSVSPDHQRLSKAGMGAPASWLRQVSQTPPTPGGGASVLDPQHLGRVGEVSPRGRRGSLAGLTSYLSFPNAGRIKSELLRVTCDSRAQPHWLLGVPLPQGLCIRCFLFRERSSCLWSAGSSSLCRAWV